MHPPGGLVGGDALEITLKLKAQAHALITTPGATRFYKSLGDAATQTLHAQLEDGARLEWLPLETLAYDQCQAHNHAVFALTPGAELMGWDITALGLPLAQRPFERGTFSQHIDVPGVRREQGRIDAADLRLTAGATSPHPQVLVVRVLSPLVEPAMDLFKALRICWRACLWDMPAISPRIWAT